MSKQVNDSVHLVASLQLPYVISSPSCDTFCKSTFSLNFSPFLECEEGCRGRRALLASRWLIGEPDGKRGQTQVESNWPATT